MLDQPSWMQRECNNWIIRHIKTKEVLDVGSFDTEDEAADVLAHLPLWEDEYEIVCDDESVTD